MVSKAEAEFGEQHGLLTLKRIRNVAAAVGGLGLVLFLEVPSDALLEGSLVALLVAGGAHGADEFVHPDEAQ